MEYVSLKIWAETLPRLRMLSALTGKRITVLIDDFARSELAKLDGKAQGDSQVARGDTSPEGSSAQ
jgi:hypothetical protein